jgi:hypothetical protein
MGPAPKDITGHRFQKLVALELVEVRPGKRDRVRMWRCRCDCGNEPLVAQRNLTAGNTASCGCIVGKHKRTHGATDTPEFMAWVAMRQRCENPRVKSFKDYGARGISVCLRWQTFETFLADMGQRPSSAHSIDREHNDGNYEPGNCRWATVGVQNNNRRSNLRLTFNGETKTAAEWERKIGLKTGMVSKRLAMGWALARVLATVPQ